MKKENKPLTGERIAYDSPSSEVIEVSLEQIVCESGNTDDYNPKNPWS
ncbi:MAG: hypothetical protein IJK44_01195 [Bacteroidales bacterium]|nr:hypothetical protein [Bacteroidales bacterium]